VQERLESAFENVHCTQDQERGVEEAEVVVEDEDEDEEAGGFTYTCVSHTRPHTCVNRGGARFEPVVWG